MTRDTKVVALIWLAAAAVAYIVHASQPTPQVTLPCRVVSVHDGDTCTVDVTIRMNVRLLDCWAPELKEAGGPASKAKLESLVAGKSGGLVTIPLGDTLGDSLTFGRVLGRLTFSGKDVSEQMVKSGAATKEKRK